MPVLSDPDNEREIEAFFDVLIAAFWKYQQGQTARQSQGIPEQPEGLLQLLEQEIQNAGSRSSERSLLPVDIQSLLSMKWKFHICWRNALLDPRVYPKGR